jgi:hypothetical protein
MEGTFNEAGLFSKVGFLKVTVVFHLSLLGKMMHI